MSATGVVSASPVPPRRPWTDPDADQPAGAPCSCGRGTIVVQLDGTRSCTHTLAVAALTLARKL